MSGRKIGLLLLIVLFGATVETAWHVRGDVSLGPEGCRVMGGRFYGPSWTYEQSATRALAGSAPRIEVRNTFGSVRLSAGAPGNVQVRLRKVVFQPTEDKARAFAEKVELRIDGEGQPLRIGTNREELERGSGNVGFETHLEIEAPADAVLLVRNEHGAVDVAGFAAAEIDSSFDGVTAERIAGDLRVQSRHGEVRVDQVGGALDLSSRHGSVEVSGIKGLAKIDVQYGDLTTRQTAALQVQQQHGRVTADGVAGDLSTRAGHSEVQASDVTGVADVETSYGTVQLARVGGDARAIADRGGVSVEDVTGRLEARASHGRLDAARVGGFVEANVDHGEVQARGLAAGLRLRASGGDTVIEGVSGPIDVELDRGSAQVLPRAVITAPVTVNVVHGSAQLQLPKGSRVDVETESSRGEVHSDLSALQQEEKDHRRRGERLSGRLEGGGVAVKVRADGDVTLEAAEPERIAEHDIAPPRVGASPAPAAGTTSSPAAEATPSPAPRKSPGRPAAEAPAPAAGTRAAEKAAARPEAPATQP